ncbi:ABC transporter permease [Conexibacter woesei]|uniref:ABC transporter permease n=1 Tax=Conexibacter woesei TaxID=191495 RepID=UPI000402BDF4|nr:ABC transporter permease [Conexibacter woesei]
MSAAEQPAATTAAPSPPPARPAGAATRRAQMVAFWALCERDFWVAFRRQVGGFLAQTLLQPVFYLFIFGRVLPEIGAAGQGYGSQLLPGVIALTLFLTALQNTSLPLVIEFSFTKEIEDRLLAPLPAGLVGLQKVVVAAVRGIVGAIIILPLAAVILPGGVDFSDISWPGFIAVMLIGPLAGAAVGLVLGTAVEARQINVVFAVVLTPLLFTGATFYPWAALDSMRWFQVITLLNPLTYVSEGLRAAVTDADHLGNGWIALGLVGWTVAFTLVGVRLFERRAVD